MTGRMIEFDANGATAPGYLATPEGGSGPGIVVLHEWWGLTEPFRQACDWLADAGFVALAPDLYRGKTADTEAEAEKLSAELDQKVEQWRGDITGALQFLRQHGATIPADGRGAFGTVAFSLGGAYALDMSVQLPDEIAAVVNFYATYPGLDYQRAKAAYLFHFAENDQYEPAESTARMEQELQAAGRPVTVYTYPGTIHGFFGSNRPAAYDPEATALAWERTLAFLNAELRRP
jgi:carboxymethylenebutenolidase